MLKNIQARIELQKEFDAAMQIDDFTAAERLQVLVRKFFTPFDQPFFHLGNNFQEQIHTLEMALMAASIKPLQSAVAVSTDTTTSKQQAETSATVDDQVYQISNFLDVQTFDFYLGSSVHIAISTLKQRLHDLLKCIQHPGDFMDDSSDISGLSKLLPRHEEDTFEIMEIHTVSTEIQNDANFRMNLHLEGKGGSGSISLLPHFLTPI